MHVQTHIMSGWCAASLFNLSARERLLCMVAATVPDVDGLGVLLGQEVYWEYHHKLGHNVFLGVLLAVVLACLSSRRLVAAGIYLMLFHLHLSMDYVGSGIGWRIYYLWPASKWGLINSRTWDFYSWQNITAAVAFLAWVIGIAMTQRRTPLEAIMPSLDRQLVLCLRKKARRRDL